MEMITIFEGEFIMVLEISLAKRVRHEPLWRIKIILSIHYSLLFSD